MADRKPKELRALDADPRYTEIPIPCMHCKHLVSLGSQFDAEGWTCAAYPTGIPYGVLTMRTPHADIEPDQPGDMVAYDPRIYKEEDTGKEWHYTADGDWKYVDGSPRPGWD
mgnify:CR=1 FL=1